MDGQALDGEALEDLVIRAQRGDQAAFNRLIADQYRFIFRVAFRVVGHYFSVRGARSGLDRIRWIHQASEPLSELRGALAMEPAVRLRQVEDVAVRLRLDHLATFFQRIVVS